MILILIFDDSYLFIEFFGNLLYLRVFNVNRTLFKIDDLEFKNICVNYNSQIIDKLGK